MCFVVFICFLIYCLFFFDLEDPNKKEREEEQKLRKEVKASKKQWRSIRKQRFSFLDANVTASGDSMNGMSVIVTTAGVEEKKINDSSTEIKT